MAQVPPLQFLARQLQVAGIAARFLHVLLGLDQHAARTAGGVVDRHALLRLDDLDHHADDFGGRVELAALLARAVGKILDEVLVGRPQQIGELEVVVAQRDFVEVLDERDQRAVVHRPLADAAVEVDPLQHVLERVRVGVFDGGQGLVQPRTDRRFQVGDADVTALFVGGTPAGFQRHVEIVLVGVGKLFFDQVGLHAPPLVLGFQRGTVLAELVAHPFQEQHPEDVFLVLRGIHVAPQDVAGFEQLPFQAGQRQLLRLFLGLGWLLRPLKSSCFCTSWLLVHRRSWLVAIPLRGTADNLAKRPFYRRDQAAET